MNGETLRFYRTAAAASAKIDVHRKRESRRVVAARNSSTTRRHLATDGYRGSSTFRSDNRLVVANGGERRGREREGWRPLVPAFRISRALSAIPIDAECGCRATPCCLLARSWLAKSRGTRVRGFDTLDTGINRFAWV